MRACSPAWRGKIVVVICGRPCGWVHGGSRVYPFGVLDRGELDVRRLDLRRLVVWELEASGGGDG